MPQSPEDRIRELEEALRQQAQEREEADARAARANVRARDAEDSYRRAQLDLVTAKDEASSARDEAQAMAQKLAALEAATERSPTVPPTKVEPPSGLHVPSSVPPKSATKPPTQPPSGSEPPPAQASPKVASAPPNEAKRAVEMAVKRIGALRELLGHASRELSQLHADEVALSAKRARVLRDACALIARAVGESGEAPPPIPSAALEARLTVHPVLDISEVAELLESLRPPSTPKVE